jgi:hypothetical protein
VLQSDHEAPDGTVECDDIVDASAPIRQGDVLRWLPESEDPWRQFAIVVTADCDIVHRKHAGALATVPVLRHDHYLAAFSMPKKLQRQEDALRPMVRSRIRTLQKEYRPDHSGELSDQAIDTWIASTEARPILTTLRCPVEKWHLIEDAIGWLRAVPAVSAALDLRRQFELLVQARVLATGKAATADTVAKLVRENLDLEHLPGDAFFLHSLGSGQRAGYVVYLRRFENVGDGDIALRTIDLHGGARPAIRIARLRSPYIFRLTQQLAQVFADIGLPGSYEASRARFTTERVQSLQGDLA